MEKRIILVGVGHVFNISTQVEGIIDTVNPDVVALELDKNRLSFLLNPSTKRDGIPLFYLILSKIQRKIAKMYGVTTGSEMVACVKKAEDKGIGILCIDMDARLVAERLWREISFKKKMMFVLGSIFSIFITKKKIENELRAFEDKPFSYFNQISIQFPEFNKILIDDRNEFMYNKLLKALDIYDVIVAFVGEGHILGLQKLLESKVSMTAVHLKDLRENNWKEKLSEGNPV
ncbi:MAG: TraB/GumN family protein [Candidatus Thermoplasmatota archaeon]|nr:TraB/GumN family protein [Candidatus Thermoplasmatota archaeon]